MKKLIATLIASIALVGFVSNLQAADSAPVEKPAKAKKPGATQFRGTVSAVDKSANTISVKNTEKTRVFEVVGETKITKNGSPATVADAAVGDYATGSYLDKAGKLELKSLKLGPAPKKK